MMASLLLAKFSFGQLSQVPFEKLESLQKEEQRPVVVFLHTSWCSYCGSMKNSTFKRKELVELINNNFYFISLDIEEKKDITFGGRTFKYKPTGPGTGIHELAEQIGTINGAIAYPGIAILNAENEIVYQKEGYVSATDFINLLKRLYEISSGDKKKVLCP